MIRLIFVFSIVLCSQGYASSILWHIHDAVVWQPEQTLTGELSGFTAERLRVHHNGRFFPVEVIGGRKFTFTLMLRDQKNKIWVEAYGGDIVSDTLYFQLGYKPLPVVKPFATVREQGVMLQATLLENPYKAALRYVWFPDAGNPAYCRIIRHDSTVLVRIPQTPGTYYFNLLVVAGNDSVWFQTFVKRDAAGLHAFDMDSAYPLWMDRAVLYQITPYTFVKDGTFQDITAKLREIKSLGVNTLWLQPVFASFFGGQGYDVTGYLSLNPQLGTASQLHELIAAAEALEMRVLFDLVLNHTSIHHPYARDRIKYGVTSHYYNYYQHKKEDGKPYSSYYNQDEHGFINYFWKHLVNLNYKNEEVQRWMLEVCKYWVREYGIDGYRFDAIWGVNARMPSFAKRLRTELKSIQPDILMLAEDKGSVAGVFELGFDAAYDWTPDTGWVSQTSWEYQYHPRKSFSVFNFPEVSARGGMLRQALFDNGDHPHRLLRYMENNDLPRFIHEHGPARTKMAAALLFSLPGIPMVYNGQEIGSRGHPYSTNAIFHRDRPIKSLDETGLFGYYQKLMKMHKRHPALRAGAMRPLPLSPDAAMVAFHRWQDSEHFIIIVNLDSARTEVRMNISEILPENASAGRYRLKDLLAAETFQPEKNQQSLKIPMEGYSVRWLLLKETDYQ